MIETTKDARKELPSGWRWVRLGDVCDFLDSKRVPVNDAERQQRIAGKSQSDLYPYFGANGQLGWIDAYLFDEPLILLAEDGGFFGSKDRAIAYKIAGKTWVNNHAHVLRPRAEIDFDFCLHALAIRPDVGHMVTGNTRPKLNQEIAAHIPIPLPPLAEQKRIAAKLNNKMAAVERARAAAETQLEVTESLPAAYLRQIFPQPGQELPADWRWVRLGDYTTKVGSGITPLGGQSSYLSSGIPLIRSQNIHFNRFVQEGLAYISKEQDAAMGSSRVKRDDVLLNITGASIGRVCVVPARLCPANVNQHVSIVRCKSDIYPEFLSFFISTPQFQDFIFNTQAGATRQALTKALIEDFSIPLPPLAEQKRIAEELNKKMMVLKQLRAELEIQLDEINALPSILLHQAFNGEL